MKQLLNERLAAVLPFIDFVDEQDASSSSATTAATDAARSSGLFDSRYPRWSASQGGAVTATAWWGVRCDAHVAHRHSDAVVP